MPLHALYDPRQPHELVTDAKGRLVTISYAEWCSFRGSAVRRPASTGVHPLTDQQSSTVH